MSGNLTPVYDSLCTKTEVTRRRIFKDHNGKYKERLEIRNREKRTLFGALPFEGNSNWKLEDLSDVDDDAKISESEMCRKKSISSENSKKPSDGDHEGSSECGFKETLQKIIDKLKDDRIKSSRTQLQGVKNIIREET